MPVVVAFPVELHVHLGAPGQPELLVSRGEIDGAIVDEEMVLGEPKPFDGIPEIGFNTEHGITRAGDPDASLDRDVIRRVTRMPRPDTSGFRVAFFFEANLPSRLSAHVGQSFTGMIEAIAIKRLQDIHAQAVKAGA